MTGRSTAYIPDRGDLVWIDFDPQAGHEQAKRRPALVLSPALYNRGGLCLVCPITSKSKKYPYEVPVMVGGKPGVILSDQIRSFDWRARQAKRIGKTDDDTLAHALQKSITLLR